MEDTQKDAVFLTFDLDIVPIPPKKVGIFFLIKINLYYVKLFEIGLAHLNQFYYL